MKNKILKNMDWGILICTLILLAIGLVALFSATQSADYEELKKHALFMKQFKITDGHYTVSDCQKTNNLDCDKSSNNNCDNIYRL